MFAGCAGISKESDKCFVGKITGIYNGKVISTCMFYLCIDGFKVPKYRNFVERFFDCSVKIMHSK